HVQSAVEHVGVAGEGQAVAGQGQGAGAELVQGAPAAEGAVEAEAVAAVEDEAAVAADVDIADDAAGGAAGADAQGAGHDIGAAGVVHVAVEYGGAAADLVDGQRAGQQGIEDQGLVVVEVDIGRAVATGDG